MDFNSPPRERYCRIIRLRDGKTCSECCGSLTVGQLYFEVMYDKGGLNYLHAECRKKIRERQQQKQGQQV